MKQARLINNIVGGSYVVDERFAGCAISENLYAESVEETSNGYYYTTALRSVEGERVVVSGLDGFDSYAQGCRGMFTASDGSVFSAFGDAVYRTKKNVSTGEYYTSLIYRYDYSSIGRVCFCETGGINSHVCWVDGSELVMAYPIAPEKAEAAGFAPPLKFHTPLRQYLTSDEVKNDSNEHICPNQICSMNGTLIINDPETDTWYYTDAYILGGTSYKREIYSLDKSGNVQYKPNSAYEVLTKEVRLTDFDPSNQTSYLWLDRYSKPRFNTASFSADKITGMVVSVDNLFAIGTRSIQVYSQTTSTDAQGFSSIVFSSMGRNIDNVGCDVLATISNVNGVVAFLGSSVSGGKAVWAISGGTPSRISTNAIEREIEQADVSGAYACSYSSNGHFFYVITIPSIYKTYVYDFATRQWHNRTTQNETGRIVNWWAGFITSSCGDILIAGAGVGVIAVLDKFKYDDYLGNPIVKRRTTPVLISDHSEFIIEDLLLVWNNGTTKDINNVEGAKNPIVMLEVSEDGGNTFGDEMWADGGEAGQYNRRTIWYGIGAVGTEIVFRITISDRVNVVITGSKVGHTILNGF